MKKETFLLILRLGFTLMVLAYFFKIKQVMNENKEDTPLKSQSINESLD
jgi:uncharacterized membrane protein YgaE (UPF0421/DUF939 family)|tara:strand:- start:440 stop:586 length:147 start_codon:yes stop_codon:yes gene_type:complete